MRRNYFVCTLGQAAIINNGRQHPYRTISDFLSYQASQNGQLPAVGFPIPHTSPNQWTHKILTFQDVDRGARIVAERLLDRCGPTVQDPQTIGLLSQSSPEFLFTWLALMKLGHAVLIIAPQCQATAIQHLCNSCNVSLLIHDGSHADAVYKAASAANSEEQPSFHPGLLPIDQDEDIFEIINQFPKSDLKPTLSDELAVAYLHHTSGTSSGLPKPIPQSHRAAIGVLPHIPEIPSKATFTTTPLYHGGIADLFRAWTSDALIWLFPGKDVPITARNICLCLDIARECAARGESAGVNYFSSVPYVLQMMKADEQGLALLKTISIVGVGGAALPAEVGNRLVNEGVNLISRFGSAECGFLLSSYRDFDSDIGWQYLRNHNPPHLLSFEEKEDGLSELVIKPEWPHMAKTNRPDGSFATADLFTPHPSIPNAWLYHSRADSQLTLITGKKFDPAPLEASIATSSHLDDALIFGNHRPFPGALLLRSKVSESIPDDQLLQEIWPAVDKLNRESQSHARIAYNMLIPLPHQSEGLEKSSKGTVNRKAAEERFKTEIEQAYSHVDADGDQPIADIDLPNHLTGLIKSILSQTAPVGEHTDLFSYGMDSIACMQLRNRIRTLVPNNARDLPLSIVEDCGTIERLSDYVKRKRHGNETPDTEDEERLMADLVREYGIFKQEPSEGCTTNNTRDMMIIPSRTILLTGATGALGAHVLDLLRKSKDVSHIYCLVRGADDTAARERVSKALEQRGFDALSSQNASNQKVRVLRTQLGDSHLGLSKDVYEQLAGQVDLILHIAWTVNFRLKLRNFVKDDIAGVKHLLDFALAKGRSQPPRFVFCSSTAAVMNAKQDLCQSLPEAILDDPSLASPLGYSRSKWVAEQLCHNASQQKPLQGYVTVVRIGQLSGDSNNGIWNTKEAWPMMLSTVKLTGSLPDLPNEHIDWLPVDIAAQALVEIGAHVGNSNKLCQVLHVLNNHQQPSWSEMLRWCRNKEAFDIVSPQEWLALLETHKDSNHPALKLLGLWKDAYGNATSERITRPRFCMVETKKAVPVMRDIEPINEEYMARIWAWMQANMP
jgi:thioester reductase-like protein